MSTDNLSGLTHLAVSSLRRWVGSGSDHTPSQQDLVSTSKAVEERWQRRRLPVDAGTVELWCAGLRDELTLLTAPADGRPAHRPLSESAMVGALEAARIISRTTRRAAAENFAHCGLVPLLVTYAMTAPLTKRLREVCGVVLSEVPGDQPPLMRPCLEASLAHLAVAAPAAPAAEPPADGSDADGSPLVDPRAVHLASLLVSALHRADAVGAVEQRPREAYPVEWAVTLLRGAHTLLFDDAAAATTTEDSHRITAAVVYLSLLSGLVRGNGAVKQSLLAEHRDVFCRTWTAAASNLGRMDLVLPIPTPTAGKDALVTLGDSAGWESELLELLVEAVTDDSFTLRRLAVHDAVDANSPVGLETPTSQMRSPGQHSPSGAASPGFGVRRFDALPAHWDTLLTSGSEVVWRTASCLTACTIRADAVSVVERCLLGLDCSSVVAEAMYRKLITTLMLLCAAHPCNAQRLIDRSMVECLAVLVTDAQPSVFSRAMLSAEDGADEEDESGAQGGRQLATNTTQLTEHFMSSLAATYFPKRLVELLMRAIERMPAGRTCQTDADVVEALLHVLATTYTPPRVLFFPGCGSVVCKLDGFAGRWSGYSFSAWINPMCVWAEGSHLFSFTEDAGASVALVVLANGRTCSLALRVRTSKDLLVSTIPESSLPAETWSHIVLAQGLGGTAIFVNGRKLPSLNANVPFPQASSKHHRLDMAFGGNAEEASFYGYVASMELIGVAMGEKEVGKLYAKGPGRTEPADSQSMLLISAPAVPPTSSGPTPNFMWGSLVGKSNGVSVNGVVAYYVPDTQAILAECGVMSWALQTLRASHTAANFNVVAKLCITSIATTMQLSNSAAELDAILQSAGDSYLEVLKAEVLGWEDTFLDFPAIMLRAATPRGGGKVLRSHPSTQVIFATLLERLEAVGAVGGDSHLPSSRNSMDLTSRLPGLRNHVSASSILRELSDCLLAEENVRVFGEVPGRFDRILAMGLHLPPECIEAVVLLVEKLCKTQANLESLLRFLVEPPPGCGGGGGAPLTASPTVSSSSLTISSADAPKAELLRMLFDVARADAAMCDRVVECFKGNGVSFLVSLVNGRNHASETIRVFALRLLSLILHSNRRVREGFVKGHGYEVLGRAITDPQSCVPIRLATMSCLLHMALDGYRPTSPTDGRAPDHASTGSLLSGKGKTKKSKHRNPGGAVTGSFSHNLGFPGHLPGLVSGRLKVTRREYSFETAHDYGRVDDRLQFEESYRGGGSGGSDDTLHIPPAFRTALTVLGHLITSASVPGYSGGPSAAAATGAGDDAAAAVGGPAADSDDLPPRGMSSVYGLGDADGISTASAKSPAFDEEPPERVVTRVMAHLEKVLGVRQSGMALLPFPWMEWLWEAVQGVAVARRGSSAASPLSPVAARRFSKKFTSAVMLHTRRIIRALVVLDMTTSSKAPSIRRLRGMQQPPYLLRIVLEEVCAHFSKSDRDTAEKESAANVIRNLDTLLRHVHYALEPMPLALGSRIVDCISAIAVRNNTWVRMRMKKNSNLFDTRDQLAFSLLASVKHFAGADANVLMHIVSANGSEPDAAAVLLHNLCCAVNGKDVDAVEVILLLTRGLIADYEDQHGAICALLGSDGAPLAELICSARTGEEAARIAPDGAAPSPSAAADDANDDSEDAGDGSVRGQGYAAASAKLPTSQVIEWCCSNPPQWEAITASCRQRAERAVASRAKGDRERVEKERSSISKATASQREAQAQLSGKVNEELARVRAEVRTGLKGASPL